MRKIMTLAVLAVFTFFISTEMAFPQRGGRTQGGPIVVRLASPVPRNSDWGRTLERVAGEWAKATNNQVQLRVIHDGIEGGEAKTLSSLATNNIQASLFTSFGLAMISPEVMTLSVPFLISNDTELSMVMREVEPILEAKISSANYVVLTWSKSGWVNVFSKDPVFVPDQLRKHRLATSPESGELNTALRMMGFHLVETEMVDIGTRLANNTIDAIYQSPAAVAPLRIHRTLGNMLDIPIAPFVGAIVINRVTWNQFSPEQQQELMRITRRIAAEFDATMPKTIENALTMMQKDGLTINRATSEQQAQWRAELQKVLPPLLGTTFDRDLYQKIVEILERSRGGSR